MKFLHSNEYTKGIKSLFSSENDLDLAVAFFGIDSYSLFEKSSHKNIKLICNLESGACNPDLIEKVSALDHVTVKTNPRLHAKTLISGDSTIIGSANISSNGLSLEGKETTGWIETGVLSTDILLTKKTKQWFMSQWKSSNKITPQIMDSAKQSWGNKRNRRAFSDSSESIIDAAFLHPEEFINRKIYFAVYKDRKLSQEAFEAFDNAKDSYNMLDEHLGLFENWSELPNDSYLISVYHGPRGGVIIDGIYKTPEKRIIEKFSYNDGSDGDINYCFKHNNIENYKLTKIDRNLISKNIENLVPISTSDDDAFTIALVDGVKALKND